MLSFAGRNTLAPVSNPFKQNFHTYRNILKTLMSNVHSTRWRIQLSVTKSFNLLLAININLESVVRKFILMSWLSQHERPRSI